MSDSPYREIELELIDPPALAMREELDEDALQDLIDSIRAIGLVEPVIVKPAGDRFEIVAGHRRWIACKYAGLARVPCLLTAAAGAAAEAIKVAENTDREAVNAAHEGAYFDELLRLHCGDDVDELCRLVKRKRSYVEPRLLLHRSGSMIRDAVAGGVFGMTVAAELLKVRDERGLANLLDYARNGATAKMIRQARIELENFLARQAAGTAPAAGELGAAAVPIAYQGPSCICCRGTENANQMQLVHVHDYCLKAILLKLLENYYGSAPAASHG